MFFFLVACMRLYTSLCWLAHPLVCRKSLHFSMHLELKVDQIWVTAPAQLPYWPCILSGSQESFHRLKGERNPSDFIDIHLFFTNLYTADHFLETRPYTRQHQSRAGGQGQYSSWAGAVTQIWSSFSSKRPKMRSDYRPTDGRTDGPT